MTLQWMNKCFSSEMKVCDCHWGDGQKCAEVRKIHFYQAEGNWQVIFCGFFCVGFWFRVCCGVFSLLASTYLYFVWNIFFEG